MKNILGPISSVIIVLWSAGAASAGTVELTWTANSEPDIAGYIVFYGTRSQQYVAAVDVGNQTSFQFVPPDPTMRYFFAVRAYNTSGLQSDFSAEASTADPIPVQSTDAIPNVPISPPISEAAHVRSPHIARARLDADKPAPQPAGSQIVFTATASGGNFYKYKWWIFDGVQWAIAKDWSSSNTFTWTPAAANVNYRVLVRVRHGAGRSRASAGTTIPFPIKEQLTAAHSESVDAIHPLRCCR
jgi:hypothetical protein